MHEGLDIAIKYNIMNILKFVESFPDEPSCKEHFRLRRDSEGVNCKKCQGTNHYWLKGKFQCIHVSNYVLNLLGRNFFKSCTLAWYPCEQLRIEFIR